MDRFQRAFFSSVVLTVFVVQLSSYASMAFTINTLKTFTRSSVPSMTQLESSNSSPNPSIGTKKIALVTGANKGIGKEIVRRFYNEPDIITILACRNTTLGEAARKEIIQSSQNGDANNINPNEKLVVCYLDLTNHDSIKSTADFIEKKYGKLDILVNNAAICFNDPTLYGKVPQTKFEDQASITIETNYFGTLKIMEVMLPYLLKSTTFNSPSRIINIASSAGRLSILKSKDYIDMVTSPSLTIQTLSQLMQDFVESVQTKTHQSKGFPNTCYGMSKLGIIALSQIFARQYNQSLHQDDEGGLLLVNSVDPGYCATDQNDFQGFVSAKRGSLTPYLLATLKKEQMKSRSGGHFFEEHEITW